MKFIKKFFLFLSLGLIGYFVITKTTYDYPYRTYKTIYKIEKKVGKIDRENLVIYKEIHRPIYVFEGKLSKSSKVICLEIEESSSSLKVVEINKNRAIYDLSFSNFQRVQKTFQLE